MTERNLKFPPPFKGQHIGKYKKTFLRYKILNSWSEDKSIAVLMTSIPDHLAEMIEVDPPDTLELIFSKIAEELDSSSDLWAKLERVNLVDGRVDSFVVDLREAAGSQCSDDMILSALKRQLPVEISQSAMLHTDGTLTSVQKHAKSFFKSRTANPVHPLIAPVSIETSAEVKNLIETQEKQLEMLTAQSKLLQQWQPIRQPTVGNALMWSTPGALFVRVCLADGPYLWAMLDTGAMLSSIHADVGEKFRLSVCKDNLVTLKIPNGQLLSSCGKVNTRIRVDETDCGHITCEVLPGLVTPMILGLDFLATRGCNLQIADMVVSLPRGSAKVFELSAPPNMAAPLNMSAAVFAQPELVPTVEEEKRSEDSTSVEREEAVITDISDSEQLLNETHLYQYGIGKNFCNPRKCAGTFETLIRMSS